MGTADVLAHLMGRPDPRQGLIEQILQQAGGTPAPVDPTQATPAGGGAAPGAALPAGATPAQAAIAASARQAPLPPTAQSPQDLAAMYTELMDNNRVNKMFDQGLALTTSSFGQEGNRRNILAAMMPGDEDDSVFGDPNLVNMMIKLQGAKKQEGLDARQKASIPGIAAELGIPVEAAAYLHSTGQLDDIYAEKLKTGMKPDLELVKNPDGTWGVVDKKTATETGSGGKAIPKQVRVEKLADGKLQAISEDGQPIGEPYGPEDASKYTYKDDAQGRTQVFKDGKLVESVGQPKPTQPYVGPDGKDYGQPPKDFEYLRNGDGTVTINPDNNLPMMQRVKGSEADTKASEAKSVEDTKKNNAIVGAAIVTDSIRKVTDQIDGGGILPKTGMVGSLLSYLPGSDQHDIQQNLNTIKANVGFGELQKMRAASPTGAALGPVSDFENKLLQAVMGSVEQSQTDGQLKYNLQRLDRIYQRVIDKGVAPDDPEAKELLDMVQGTGKWKVEKVE